MALSMSTWLESYLPCTAMLLQDLSALCNVFLVHCRQIKQFSKQIKQNKLTGKIERVHTWHCAELGQPKINQWLLVWNSQNSISCCRLDDGCFLCICKPTGRGGSLKLPLWPPINFIHCLATHFNCPTICMWSTSLTAIENYCCPVEFANSCEPRFVHHDTRGPADE